MPTSRGSCLPWMYVCLLMQDATFVRQYRTMRTDYHRRALLAERAAREQR